MSIATEITRIKGQVASSYNKISSKGGTVIGKSISNLLPDPSGFSLSNITNNSGELTYAANTTAMAQYSLPTPIAGHKYYGRVDQKVSAGTTFGDGRFEYFGGDGAGKNIVFTSFSDAVADGNWHTYSSIQSFPSLSGENWTLRSFAVNATQAAYRRNHMIIDLTAAFGAGNEPTKEWCDASILYFTGTKTIAYPMNTTNLASAINSIPAAGNPWDGSWSYAYELGLTAEGPGSVSGGGLYLSGDVASLNASPNANKMFNGWYDGSSRLSTSFNYNYSVNADKTLTGKFADFFSVGSGGTASITGDRKIGGSISGSATPSSGYMMGGWYLNGTQKSTSTSYSMTIAEGSLLEARFLNRTVTVEVTGSGSSYAYVNGSNTAQTFTKQMGESISLHVKAEDSGAPGTITINGTQQYSGTDGTVNFTIPERCTYVKVEISSASKKVSSKTKYYGIITLTSQQG